MTEPSGSRTDTPVLPEDTYRRVFAASPDGILVVDRAGIIRDANPEAIRLFGYERHELVGHPIERLVPPEIRGKHTEYREGFHRNPETRPMGIGLQLRGVRKDGREFPVEVSLNPFMHAEGEFVVAVVRDSAERDRLRRLGGRVLEAVEDERRRIARELHDDTAQRLAALLVRLRVLEKTPDEAGRARILTQLHEQLSETMESIRQMSRGLRPPALEDVGLETAIRSHLRALLEGSDLEVTLDVAPTRELLGPDAQLMAYRVIQEAAFNVVRHAQAGSLRIRVAREGDRVAVTIADDGIGFDPEGALMEGAFLEKGGLGLVGMDERARLVGGILNIESALGQGTVVTLRIPTQEEAPHG